MGLFEGKEDLIQATGSFFPPVQSQRKTSSSENRAPVWLQEAAQQETHFRIEALLYFLKVPDFKPQCRFLIFSNQIAHSLIGDREITCPTPAFPQTAPHPSVSPSSPWTSGYTAWIPSTEDRIQTQVSNTMILLARGIRKPRAEFALTCARIQVV